MAADIVKQGYVKFQSKSLGKMGGLVWNRKWLMLRRQSCKGPVRLEKYKDESTASVMSIYGADKKIIDLTRVDRIERLPESVKKHGISIHVDASNSIQFCVGSEMEAESWSSAIRDEIHPENRQTHETFAVYMLPNDYMSTPGDCTLQLTRDSLRLLERYGGRQLASWPLSGLRRFGVERNMFTFEAGSSCPTGSGTYFFSGDDSEFIYQRIQSLSQASARTNSSAGNAQSSFSESNWGNISSIHELGILRGGGGGGGGAGGGQTADQENPYEFDASMPTDRPPVRSNSSVQRSSGPSTRGRGPGGQQGEYAYSELPADVRPPPLRSNTVTASTSSSMHVRAVDGPYYTVSRPNNTNHAASQEQRTTQTNLVSANDVRPPPLRSNTVTASTSSSMHVRAVDGPYYTVSRPNNTNQATNQEQRTTQTNLVSANGSRRAPMERSRTVDSPSSSGPPLDSSNPTAAADGRIRAVRVEGDYYAVTRGKHSSTNQGGSSDLIQSDRTNGQARAGVARMSANNAAGQGASSRGEESPYYAVTATYGSNDQDDDDEEEEYSTPTIRAGGPRPVRR